MRIRIIIRTCRGDKGLRITISFTSTSWRQQWDTLRCVYLFHFCVCVVCLQMVDLLIFVCLFRTKRSYLKTLNMLAIICQKLQLLNVSFQRLLLTPCSSWSRRLNHIRYDGGKSCESCGFDGWLCATVSSSSGRCNLILRSLWGGGNMGAIRRKKLHPAVHGVERMGPRMHHRTNRRIYH